MQHALFQHGSTTMDHKFHLVSMQKSVKRITVSCANQRQAVTSTCIYTSTYVLCQKCIVDSWTILLCDPVTENQYSAYV